MTYKEKLRADHPEWDDKEIEYKIDCECPSDFGYEEFTMRCPVMNNDCTSCWDREIPEATAMVKNTPSILDSGDRTEFTTGAVRDMRVGKGRCDLMPLEVASHMLENNGKDDQVLALIRIFQKTGSTEALYIALDEFRMCVHSDTKTMLLEVAKHFEEGAKKYGESNWRLGIPVHCYIDSAVRHYLKWLRGDKDEPHDRAFVWNLMCCIWEVDYHEKKEEDKINE